MSQVDVDRLVRGRRRKGCGKNAAGGVFVGGNHGLEHLFHHARLGSEHVACHPLGYHVLGLEGCDVVVLSARYQQLDDEVLHAELQTAPL